jgi:D-alanyl-D-alanine dipeptidase
MKKIILIGFYFIFFSLTANAAMINNSKQLIVVITDSWNATNGQLQRFERKNNHQSWHAVGHPWPVIVGKNGLGWAANLQQYVGPVKKEGDNKAPAGIFKLNTAFGFAAAADKKIKLLYVQITPSIVCVDDQRSTYYGQIIDSNKVKKDWHSGEIMSQYPKQYQQGIVVNYNTDGKMLGAGSCIFLHVRGDIENGTAGCTAMTLSNIQRLSDWLVLKANPMLVQLPKGQYLQLQKRWGLPAFHWPHSRQ